MRLIALILVVFIPVLALAGMKNRVMTTSDVAITQALDPNGNTDDYTSVRGTDSATDGCNIRQSAGNHFVNRAASGVEICLMAAKPTLNANCSYATNGTIVCTTDPINATTISNCSILADTPQTGTTECNP